MNCLDFDLVYVRKYWKTDNILNNCTIKKKLKIAQSYKYFWIKILTCKFKFGNV